MMALNCSVWGRLQKKVQF